MTRAAATYPLALAVLCVVLGVSASCALRLALVGNGGVAIVAGGIGLIAITSMVALVGTMPVDRHAPAAVCALVVVYAFVTAFVLPIGDAAAPSHEHGGHQHAASTT